MLSIAKEFSGESEKVGGALLLGGIVPAGLALETRQRSAIQNEVVLLALNLFDRTQAQKFKDDYKTVMHRPTRATYAYNCHGLTFAARRCAITSVGQISTILREDNYVQLQHIDEVEPGDIVIYFSEDGDADHSGIVVEHDKTGFLRNPRILSKWGYAHEVVHYYADCPYAKAEIRFFRIVQ